MLFPIHLSASLSSEVARVSMGLSVYSALLAIKRIYVARMERQWYMGIVQMAGVRRLTTCALNRTPGFCTNYSSRFREFT